MLRPPAAGIGPKASQSSDRGRDLCIASVAMVTATIFTATVSFAPSAVADSADTLSDAVTSMRSGTSCGPLRSDPLARRASEIVNRSTDTYIDHTARAVPISDPLPTLSDLGSNAKKAKVLQGAGHTEADAIKFILISGYKAIPDCSYTDYGVDLLQNKSTGYFLTSLVLTGA